MILIWVSHFGTQEIITGTVEDLSTSIGFLLNKSHEFDLDFKDANTGGNYLQTTLNISGVGTQNSGTFLLK